jgi:hypothetical protein
MTKYAHSRLALSYYQFANDRQKRLKELGEEVSEGEDEDEDDDDGDEDDEEDE